MSQLAFVLLQSVHESSNEPCYWLQWNNHVDAPNFFGGRLNQGEDFCDAARRELREELSAAELKERFAVDLSDDADFTAQLALVANSLKPIQSTPARLAMHSLRAAKQPDAFGAADTVREVQFFGAQLCPSSHPLVISRLKQLQTTTAPISGAGRTGAPPLVTQAFSARELAESSRAWVHNPFVDFAFAIHILEYPAMEQGFRPWAGDSLALACALQRTLRNVIPEAGDTAVAPAPFAEVAARVIETKPTQDDGVARTVRVELRHPNWPQNPIKLRLPWPTNGVFRQPSIDAGQDQHFRWVNRLVRRFGVPPESSNMKAKGTNMWTLTAGARRLAVRWKILCTQKESERIINASAEAGQRLALDQAKIEEALAKSLGKVLDPDLSGDDKRETWHRDDLRLYFVQTFMAYWLHAIATRAVLAALANRKSAQNSWELFRGSLEALPTGVNSLRKLGLIAPLNPVNAVDLASQLCEIRRYSYSSETRAQLPGNFRQLHTSQRGLVCPFETPESNHIGLTLYLTPKARLTNNGLFVSRLASTHLELLGLAAQFIPFSAHNDAARNTLGAKNLKQAVPVVGAEPPQVTTDVDMPTVRALEPVSRSVDLLDGPAPEAGPSMLPGVNLLVGYMPWYGLNSDDAIVISETASKTLAWKRVWTRRYRLRPGIRVFLCVEAGDTVSARQILANLNPNSVDSNGTTAERLEPLRAAEAGIVRAAAWEPPPAPWLGGVLEITIDIARPLMPGDKLTGRHGNKGVVAQIVPDHLMPRLPDDESVPEAQRGQPLEMLLNPLGVIARMNLGQIMETQLTWAAALHTKTSTETLCVAPLATKEQLKLLSKQRGIHLYMPESTQGTASTSKPVTVGWQFMLRLKHSPADKGVYRGSPTSLGDYGSLTGQPLRGRFRTGGQCLGEMELWALAAHRAAPILERVAQRALPPEAGTQQLWEALQNYLWAAGVMANVTNDKIAIRPVNEEDARQLTEFQPALESSPARVARQWRCNKCSNEFDVGVNGETNMPVAVFVTQNGEFRANLSGFLDAVGATQQQREDLRDFISDAKPQVTAWRTIEIGLASFSVTFEFTGSAHKLTLSHDSKVFQFYASSKTPIDPFTRLFWHCPTHKTGSGWLVPTAQEPVDLVNKLDRDAARQVIWFDKHQFCPVIPLRYRSSHLNADGRWERSPLEQIYRRLSAGAARTASVADGKTRSGSQPQSLEFFRRWREAAAQVAWHALTGKFSHPGWIAPLSTNDTNDGPTDASQSLRASVSQTLGKPPFGLKIASSKQGLLRRVGLRRRVNESGRFVITPNPRLRIHQVGIPMAAAAVMWQKDIVQWMEGASAAKAAEDAIPMKPGTPGAADWWRQDLRFFWFPPTPEVSQQSAENLDAVLNVLQSFVATHTNRRVMLNRQPSLHRYSMLAFRPSVLDWRLGWVLQIHPLVCKGFNADFDGDEMVLHALSDEESDFAQCMEPLHLSQRLSLATGKPVMANDQDMRLGAFSTHDEDRFLEILQKDGPADEVEKSLHQWYEQQVGHATRMGYSLSMFDLLAASAAVDVSAAREVVGKVAEHFDAASVPALHRRLNDIAGEALEVATTDSLADLINSGARAAADKHPRQLWVSRGYLDPGRLDDVSETRGGRFWCNSNLVTGHSLGDFFDSAYNGRSTLADKKLLTPHAGDITRQLVFACWGWEVHTDQCDAEVPGILTCSASETRPHTICRRCLGRLGATQYPAGLPDGFPIGLLAAQFFGERGTQLSMQSYKGGGRQTNPQGIMKLLREYKKTVDAKQNDVEFRRRAMEAVVADLQMIQAYQALHPYWLQLIARMLAQHQPNGGLGDLLGRFGPHATVAWKPSQSPIPPALALVLEQSALVVPPCKTDR